MLPKSVLYKDCFELSREGTQIEFIGAIPTCQVASMHGVSIIIIIFACPPFLSEGYIKQSAERTGRKVPANSYRGAIVPE